MIRVKPTIDSTPANTIKYNPINMPSKSFRSQAVPSVNSVPPSNINSNINTNFRILLPSDDVEVNMKPKIPIINNVILIIVILIVVLVIITVKFYYVYLPMALTYASIQCANYIYAQ